MNATATLPDLRDLRIVQLTQHWTIEAGAHYRDAVVELPDGSKRLVGIRDDLVPVAA